MTDSRSQQRADTLRQATGDDDGYRLAIDEAMVVRHLGVASGNPRDELNQILSWEVAVALDPRVSEAAQALIDQGCTSGDVRAAVIEECRKACNSVAERAERLMSDPKASRMTLAAVSNGAMECAEAITALSQSPATDAAGGWRPIDTAPRDGTPVLVWFRGRQHVAEYAPIWHEDNKHWCVRDPATGQSEKSISVHEIDPPSIDGKPIPGTFSGPTHWMPLPVSPEASHD